MVAGANSGILRKALVGGGISLIALAAALILFRSIILEQVGKFALNLYGFDTVTLIVSDVLLDQVSIKELSLSDQITLRDTKVYYAPFSLLRGNIDKVEINEFFADVSKPDDGAIKRIFDLAGDAAGDGSSDQKQALPEIILTSGTVVENSEARTFLAEFSGNLSVDQVLKAKGKAQATFVTASGPIALENMELSIHADIPAQLVAVMLEGGVIRHDSPKPDWASLNLSGSGEMTAGLSSMALSVETSDGQPLVELSGSYDAASFAGNVDLVVEALPFRKDGLQPVNLTRYARDLAPIDGTLKVAAGAQISGPEITYKGEITVENLAMEITDGHVSSARLPVEFQGKFDLEGNTQSARIALRKSDMSGEIAGQVLKVTDITADLDVQNFTEAFELEKLRGVLHDAGPNANFAPLSIELSGEMIAMQKLSVEGQIRDKSEKLRAYLTADFEVETGEGALSFTLPETKLGAKGLQVAALSSHLKSIGSNLSGLLSASGRISRDIKGNLLFSSLTAALREGRWQDKTLLAEDVSLDISGGQKDENTPFEGDITGRAGNIRIDSQNIAISNLQAGFSNILKNLIPEKEGRIVLSSARIEPKDGALFKEIQTAEGEARRTGDNVDFALELTSDFLGQYLNLEGRHSLASAAGSAKLSATPLSFSDPGLQPSDLIALDTEMTVTGGLAPEGTISWSEKGIASSGDITFDELSVKTSGGSVSGIAGNLHIDELAPLTISSQQELTARDAIAGIPLERPVVRFRVETENGSPVLYIDRLTVGLVGGSAFIEDAFIDTGAEVNRLELQLTQLDLEEVMALSNVEELVATGRVSGKVPLIFGGARLLVDNGLLAADGPGVLKMTSEAARQALGGGGEQAKLLLDVLENFRYSELSIQITKTESGDDTVKLHAAGSNPDVENNRPIILNINLSTSLDKIFNAILDGYLLSEKALRATVDGR